MTSTDRTISARFNYIFIIAMVLCCMRSLWDSKADDMAHLKEVCCFGSTTWQATGAIRDITAIGSNAIAVCVTSLTGDGTENDIQLFDLTSGTYLDSLIGHTSAIRELINVGDGDHLLSLDVDGNIRTWSARHRYRVDLGLGFERSSAVDAVVASDGLDRIAFLLQDETECKVLITYYKNGKMLENRTLDYEGDVKKISMSSDGQYLVLGMTTKLQVVDLNNGYAATLAIAPSPWNHLQFIPGKHLFVASRRRSEIAAFDVRSAESSISLHRKWIRTWADPISGECVSASSDKIAIRGPTFSQIQVFNLENALVCELNDNPGAISSLHITRDDQLIIGSDDGTIRVVNLGSPTASKKQVPTQVLGSPINCVTWITNEKIAFAGGSILESPRPRLWVADVTSGKVLDKQMMGGTSVSAVAAIHGGRTIIALEEGWEEGNLWRLTINSKPSLLRKHSFDSARIGISPDGNILAVAGPQLEIYNLHSESGIGNQLFKCQFVDPRAPYSSGRVAAVEWSDDGQQLAIGLQHESVIYIFDVRDWQDPIKIEEPSRPGLGAVAFAPNGTEIVAGYDDGSVSKWELKTLRKIWTGRHHGAVTSIDVSPDGRFFVSGSDDRTARIWDMDNGLEVAEVSNHRAKVTSVAFSKEGRFATASGDGRVIVWDLKE